MEQKEGQTKWVTSPLLRKVAFFLGLYALGFLISCAIIGSRFNAKDAVLVTMVIGTLLLVPVLLIVIVRWTTPPSTFVKLLVIGPVITIVMTLGLAWSINSRQQRCDKVAESDLEKLSEAVERLGNDLKDLDCPDLMNQFSEEHVKYLVGPYYGWVGTNARCKVLVRIEKGELRSCSLRGSRPAGNKEHRRIFRSSLLNGQKLDPMSGVCEGRPYGYFPDHLYIGSMVVSKDGKCVLLDPPEYIEKSRPQDYDR